MSGAGRRELAERLCCALRGGCEPLVGALLEQGADPNLVLPEGVAAIHLAAGKEREGGVRCLGLILHHGGDPNARSAEELTPLHVAASWGCYKCLKLLLKKGGDAELRDQDGKRAVDLALEQGNHMCVQVLQDWRRAAHHRPPDAPADLQGPRRSLSFLTEDCTEASVFSRLSEDGWDPGPPSSTRERRPAELEAELGPSWALAPRPLACSTLLRADGERPPRASPSPPADLRAAGSFAAADGSSADGSSADEPFVSAAETLEPPEAGGSSEASGAAALSARLRACSLRDSSPPEPEPRAAEDTAPGPPRLCHVTPRSKSRLEASLARLGAAAASSSSSSLFGETLEMPRRPPRRRAPAAPPEHRVALGDGHASGQDREATASLDDTVLLPGSSPGSSPTVLLGSEARGRPGASPAGAPSPAAARPLSDETLLRELRRLGAEPGPITALTRRVYARRLAALSREAAERPAGHSPELAAALETSRIPDCAEDEVALARQFERPERGRRWRGGTLKSSFNYLLLDPRATRDLPLRSHCLSPAERFRTFVQAIFYVGKGTRARPYCHLSEALSHYRAGKAKASPKVRRILEIWASGQGVISVHCFQSAVPAEAYTREACLVEAIGLRMLTNQKKGNCYGMAASWPAGRRRRLGVHMLHRAMQIFLAEGERQLRPADIQAGR
ncbi:ankyrin repeat and LEM domain-containing protein 1 [Struthio camelus]|uniref:ankyrin repeat and LEM domain-containing protein 1 n=1 Tax=Struthio camelus TaxID=8801 RepID=UPI003604278A